MNAKRLLSMALLLCALTVSAQQRVQSLSVEILGAQNTFGINYDARFRGNDGLGYRVGIGYGYGEDDIFFSQNLKGVGVPLELNYLLGHHNSKLELGFGANLGIYHVRETAAYYDADYTPDGSDTPVGGVTFYDTSSNCFGYLLFGNVGYRYQRPHGLLLRVGLSPSFNFGDKHGLHKTFFYPYLGFGWSF